MRRGSEDELRGAGNGACLELHLRFHGVVAINELRVGAVLVRGPEAEEVAVEAVNVIPARVENPAIVGHGRRPLEVLEGREGPDVAAVGVHGVQREHGHRAVVIAAATHVAVRVVGGAGGIGERLAALEGGAFARGEEDDVAARKVARVEVVVFAVGELTAPGAIHIHLEDMVEGVLGDARLVRLVLLVGKFGMEGAGGEQQLPAVKGQVRPHEAADGHVAREAAHAGFAGLEVLQQTHTAAGPRPPAIELVTHVREHAGRAFDEEERIEVKQRIRQRHLANGPASAEVKRAADGVSRIGRQALEFFGGLAERRSVLVHVGPEAALAFGEFQPALHHHSDGIFARCCNTGPGVFQRPLADAALGGRLGQGDVLLSADGIGFHFIQMKVARAFERKPEEPRLDAVQLHRQRFSVGGAVEDRPVMLVNLAELPAIAGEQNQAGASCVPTRRRSDCKRPRGRAS